MIVKILEKGMTDSDVWSNFIRGDAFSFWMI